jgi:hypothetical protein
MLFDVNRTVEFGALLRPSADTALNRLLPNRARNYRATIITNADVPSGVQCRDNGGCADRVVHDGLEGEDRRKIGQLAGAAVAP